MDCFEAMKVRRSIREYADKKIDNAVCEKLIDAARFAPTARGVEPWEFIIVRDTETLKKIGSLAPNGSFIAGANACIAVYCRDTKYYLEDGCAATQNILLAATSVGIGSCWVAGDKKPYCDEVNTMLKIPEECRLVSLIALGYPKTADGLKEKEKRPVSSMCHWGYYGKQKKA